MKEYDYSQEGVYFITICTQNRNCLFGKVRDLSIKLNPAGKMIKKWWIKLCSKYPSVDTDEYIIMPNHFHGIVIVRAIPCDRPNTVMDNLNFCNNPEISNHKLHNPKMENKNGQPHGVAPTLGNIVNWFKTMTTNEYIYHVKSQGWKSFNGRLWQRNYYERIVRNETELNKIRKYIIENPLNWDDDEYNPKN